MELICIIGLNNSGKSTASIQLKNVIEENGHTAQIESFATPLKKIAMLHCGYVEDLKNKGHRQILEDLAATMKKELTNVIFAYALLNRIRGSDNDFCIIDDLRYAHELVAINQFYPVKIILVPYQLEICDEYDLQRLNELLGFLDSYEAPYSKPEVITEKTLHDIIYGESGD